MKINCLALAVLILEFTCHAQTARVVGYLPAYRFDLIEQIDFCKLTHLNLSFANPDVLGNLKMKDISLVRDMAKSKNSEIVICIALAGGALSSEQIANWSELIDKPDNRPAFIKKIVQYVVANKLDGVDVDLEWDLVTKGYSGFVVELQTALSVEGKIITAALPNLTRYDNVSDEALEAFDFINIMSYDATGPWNPNNIGQHSSYNFAIDGIDFWKKSNSISGDKLTLGVPFYGYNFANNPVTAFTYNEMVTSNPSNSDADKVSLAYYNGRSTIEAKVTLAVQEVSGIMIWELGQDSFNDLSLLSTIHDKFAALGVMTTGLCENYEILAISKAKRSLQDRIQVYPNPADDQFVIAGENIEGMNVSIVNVLRQNFQLQATIRDKMLIYDLSSFPMGIYVIVVNDGLEITTFKLIIN